MDTKRESSRRPISSNALLAVVAALLGVLVLDTVEQRGIRAEGAAAVAGSSTQDPPESTGTLISAADQRKQIIAELRSMSQRLTAIEQRLAKPLTVKVVEMPAPKEPASRERPMAPGEK